MKNPQRHLQNWELTYHLHKDHLPTDFRQTLDTFLEFYNFYMGVNKACAQRLVPELNKLIVRHYPATAKATHPVQVEYIKDLNEGQVFGLLMQLRKLLREQKEGMNILEKYPKLERWREFYCKPSQPSTVENKHRSIYLYPNDEDWQKHKEKENRLLKLFHQWQQNRQQEYYDLVQPLLFEYMPQLNNLESDYWVLYAVTVRDSYEEWLSCCEHLELTIEYHMPPDSVNWKPEDFKTLLREQYSLYSKQVEATRDKMIWGNSK